MNQTYYENHNKMIDQKKNKSLYQDEKAYKKINAYSQKPCLHQIFTLIAFILHLILHSIWVVPPIVQIHDSILFILLAIFYLMLTLIVIDYLIITTSDPVDPLVISDESFLKNRAKQLKYQNNKIRCKEIDEQNIRGEVIHDIVNPFKTKFCSICKRRILQSSYHCSRCNRCVEQLDHHCKYLNNCIGKKNYQAFFRLLLSVTAYLLLSMGHSVWVFLEVEQISGKEQTIISVWKWVNLSHLIYSFLLLAAVQTLLCFHCYINCIRKMTTIQYLFRNTPSNQSTISSSASSLRSPK